MYRYYQIDGGEEAWKAVQADFISQVVTEKHPMFVTVLATDKIAAKDMPRDEKLALRYLGPMYVDFDAADPSDAIKDLQTFCSDLVEKAELKPEYVRLFATGSKGFHVEIPLDVFVPKIDRKGYYSLPLVFKAIAMKFAQDTMDWRVYSVGMGRMWRQPNVQRPNGRYKVPITWDEMLALTPESVVELTSAVRPLPVYPEVENPCLDLAVMFDKAQQDVGERIKAARKRKPLDPEILRRPMPSIEALMEGRGVRPGAGFNQLAMQLAIFARETGLNEDALVTKCAGLITDHQSNGNRYNTPSRREEELRRMCRVVGDDPCYEFAAGPIRSLLTHTAPDLDGIAVDSEQINKDIEEAATAPEAGEGGVLLDEYADVAGGVEVTKYGVYANTEEGMKRICGVGAEEVRIMRSMTSNKISAIEVGVTVNGKSAGPPQLVEMEAFHSASNYNKFTARFGHAFQGNESQSRATYMRLVEKGKRMGTEVYIHTKEGLAMASIPHHDNEELRKPFLLWADGRGVITEPRIANTNVKISFQGDPDPRGIYRSDLQDAPGLVEWLGEDPANKGRMKNMLTNLFRCQRPDMVGPLLGWLVACFYKPLFQKAYNQFPLLHMVGAAGSGKSAMTAAMARLFYYVQDPKTVSPSSTVFALGQFASGTESIPMIVDEYKPIDMAAGVHDKLRLMFRDAYNARDVQRGGGNRDSDSFRAISTTALTAPIIFIAEGIEEESALMERVVLITVAPPPSVIAYKWASRFHEFHASSNLLAILGKYFAAKLVMTGYSIEDLRKEFAPLYQQARSDLMLTEEAIKQGLSPEQVRERQSARERSVFNFTVAKFGLIQLKTALDKIFEDSPFEEDFEGFFAASYSRMKDLAPSTIPEYLKVLNTMVDLSYEDGSLAQAIRCGSEYGFGNIGGKDTLEMNARAMYSRYRQHCRLVNIKPLYAGEQAFIHSLRNVPSLMQIGEGKIVQAAGGTHIFDAEELQRLGLRGFKQPSYNRR